MSSSSDSYRLLNLRPLDCEIFKANEALSLFSHLTPRWERSSHATLQTDPRRGLPSRWTGTNCAALNSHSNLQHFFIVNLLSEKSARARLNAFDQKDPQLRWNIFSSKSVHFRWLKKVNLIECLQLMPWIKMLKMQCPGIANLCLSRKLF